MVDQDGQTSENLQVSRSSSAAGTSEVLDDSRSSCDAGTSEVLDGPKKAMIQ